MTLIPVCGYAVDAVITSSITQQEGCGRRGVTDEMRGCLHRMTFAASNKCWFFCDVVDPGRWAQMLASVKSADLLHRSSAPGWSRHGASSRSRSIRLLEYNGFVVGFFEVPQPWASGTVRCFNIVRCEISTRQHVQSLARSLHYPVLATVVLRIRTALIGRLRPRHVVYR